MINIKELSVGNWVNYRPGWKDEETGQIVHESGTGFPVKIEMIYFCREEGLVQYNDGQNDGIEACDYELFPVEITPEILEKNGFIKNNNRWFYDAILESYEISIYEISDGIFKVEFRDLEFGISNAESTLCNVHQLQNFLTLCGINKNIEL